MGNLGVSSKNAGDPRPFQWGRVEGFKGGIALNADKEWLIDTGAEICAITKSNGDQFDLTATGGSASATTGGGGILMKSGLTVVFTVVDAAGVNREVKTTLDVGVKPDDTGSEILGMDHLADGGALVRWDPSLKDGDLYE